MEINVASISSSFRNSFQEFETGFKQLPPEISRAVSGIEEIYKTASEQLPKILSEHLENVVKEININTRKGFRLFGR
jgi:hypothetical protein